MAEVSKQSGLVNDQSKTGRSSGGVSLEDSLPDLEEFLDFDIYPDDIPLIAEASSDMSEKVENGSIEKVVHFTDPDSGSSKPIPLNLSSFRGGDSDDYSDLDSEPFSEDDLDNILLKDGSSQTDDEGPISLSSDELDHITSDNEDYSTAYEDSLETDYHSSSGKTRITGDDDSFDAYELNDAYDTELTDDESITLGSDELDHILNADEEEEENEFETKSFFDTEVDSEEEDGSIALSPDELSNITDTDYSDTSDFETEDFIPEQPANLFDETGSEDEEIALSGDELSNLLQSGTEEEEEFIEGEAKSFFDSDEDDEEIALSPDELSNITDSEEGIETDDLSSGIESNEYGVSTAGIKEEDTPEDENISLSGDELNNILETGEIEVEEEQQEDLDGDNVKSFFDSDDDESIALSADELGNITAEQDSDIENTEIEQHEDNFDLSESTEDLELETTPNLFEENALVDEEIALSGDELNNLLESGDLAVEEAEESLGSSLFENVNEEDESIALSADELGNITAEQDFDLENTEIAEEGDNFDLSDSTEDLEIESTSKLFEESAVEDEEIALSGDELNNLLESGEIESEEADSMNNSVFEDTEGEDESIALSADELGNITAEQDFDLENTDALPPENNFDLPKSEEDLQMELSSDLFGESGEADENIAISGDELNNILESGEIAMEEASFDNPIDSGMVIGEDDFVIDDSSALSDLGDFNLEDSTFEDTKDYSDRLDSFQFGSVKKEELKKVISYMDELLGSLPDSYIKEFASSEYFELYKKIMSELEL